MGKLWTVPSECQDIGWPYFRFMAILNILYYIILLIITVYIYTLRYCIIAPRKGRPSPDAIVFACLSWLLSVAPVRWIYSCRPPHVPLAEAHEPATHVLARLPLRMLETQICYQLSGVAATKRTAKLLRISVDR